MTRSFYLYVGALCCWWGAQAQEVKGEEPNRGGTISVEARDPNVALSRLTVADGYEVNLFASEKDFPIGNPVALNFDGDGRLWVMTMPSYPQRLPDEAPNDKLVILEDTDRDGRADQHTVFADGLHVPTGFELGDGGVYVAQQPNLMFAKDTDGDDVADLRRIVLHGFGTEDSHHSISAFTWGPDGGLYFQEGTFHHSQIETAYGPVRLVNAGVFRYQPTRHWAEVFVSYPFANPWGHVFDRWGQNFIADASGGSNYFGTAITGNAPYPEKRSGMKVFTSVVRPTAGCEFVSSRHFPDEAQGNFLVNNCIGFQGIKQHQVIEEGSGFTSKEVEPLLYSSDINFRPVDIEFGPDGALYIVDWFNPLIGHMQYSLRDPGRDHSHGRIWRITYKGRPLLDPPKISEAPVAELLNLLKVYEDRTRYRARMELRSRDKGEVVRELERWVEALDSKDADYEHQVLEALWAYQTIDVVNSELLERVLKSPEPRARAAATRVARFWRNDLDNTMEILASSVEDDHPRVRLEAVVALSYVPSVDAAETALDALKHPTDYYLDYVLNETIRTLKPQWSAELAKDGTLEDAPLELVDYLVGRVSTEELERFAGSEPVNNALLTRRDVSESRRLKALDELAAMHGTDALQELLGAIKRADDSRSAQSEQTLRDLGALLLKREQTELRRVRDSLAMLAREAESAAGRRLGYAGLVTADGDGEFAWEIAAASVQGLVEFLDAMELIPAAELRAKMYRRVSAALSGLPEEAQASTGSSGVRYIRIELPGNNKELTVAEVEAYENGRNVAREGEARQSSTAFGGVASRAIDGIVDGQYTAHGQTHTESERNPWLEIDLGRERAIERVRIYNRTDSTELMKRLDGFTLRWLDEDRNPVFEQASIRAPAGVATYDPSSSVREAAIRAVVHIAGHERETFEALAKLAGDSTYREAALQALGSLQTLGSVPAEHWTAEGAASLGQSILEYVKAAPLDLLTSPEVGNALALGDKVAARLAGGAGGELRSALNRYRASVITIRPVPHQMLFDVLEFSVPAGRPVAIVFENEDVMPHNVVITAPGALEEVGELAETTATQPGAQDRDYVPVSDKVLYATALVNPGGKDRLSFIAPDARGDYPFVCTYPGHWLAMNGLMKVVEGLDEAVVARRDVAEGAGHMTAMRPFVKDWTVEDLAPQLEEPPAERSYYRGRGLFESLGCNKCHVIGGKGVELGPDLTKVREKYTGVELLRQILEPSEQVEEQYYSYLVELKNSLSHIGFLVRQNEQEVVLRSNPLHPEHETVISRSEIALMEKTPLSAMPTGLLTTLNPDEIYDLLAYVESGADRTYPAFKQE